MTALGTWICRPRFPARITTSAVITFVMLPIGLSVSRSRLHSRLPVAAFASTPPLAFTPLGAPAAGPPDGAGRGVGFARAAQAARASARAAAPRTLTPANDFGGPNPPRPPPPQPPPPQPSPPPR